MRFLELTSKNKKRILSEQWSWKPSYMKRFFQTLQCVTRVQAGRGLIFNLLVLLQEVEAARHNMLRKIYYLTDKVLFSFTLSFCLIFRLCEVFIDRTNLSPRFSRSKDVFSTFFSQTSLFPAVFPSRWTTSKSLLDCSTVFFSHLWLLELSFVFNLSQMFRSRCAFMSFD